jgi:AraC-like DNA-binding protein
MPTPRALKDRLINALPLPNVRAGVAQGFLGLAETRGHDRDRFLAAHGLRWGDLSELHREVSALRVLSMIRTLEAERPGCSIALEAAPHIPTSFFGPLGYAIQHLPTPRHAVRLLVDNMHLWSSHAQLNAEDQGNAIRLTLQHHPFVAAVRHPIEMAFVVATQMINRHDSASALEFISFPHAPLGPVGDYVAFFGIEPAFSADRAAFQISGAYLDTPSDAPDPAYARFLTDSLKTFPTFTPHADIQLQDAIAEGARRRDFSVDGLADRLNLSVRTLNRHMADQSTSASEVLTLARQDVCSRLLRDRSLSLAEVACQLGYSDERAFSRAYTRWAGKTPAAHRRGLGFCNLGRRTYEDLRCAAR